MKTPSITQSGGRFVFRITINGVKQRVYSDTEQEARARLAAIQQHIVAVRREPSNMTLREAEEKYITDRRGVLSPSTIRGYRMIQKHRFTAYAGQKINAINWQRMISDEACTCSAKTLKNAWGFVRSVVTDAGVNVPRVRLPMVIPKEGKFLEPEEIPLFLAAIKDKRGELPAMLALHGLRRSEIFGLTFENVNLKDGWLNIHGGMVVDENGRYVWKEENKNRTSTRRVPIMIPRLKTLLFIAEVSADGGGLVVDESPSALYKQINRACKAAGLPEVGVHGLRHTMASLSFDLGLTELEMQELGGWADAATMHKIYTHLSSRKRRAGVAKLQGFYAGL